ncbi:MAG: hypothetical protein F6J93_27880 [Oscillatoria sp. SIO1A7]|nr:hypothetical protein [Oscillatoria sp. SIO1A7]
MPKYFPTPTRGQGTGDKGTMPNAQFPMPNSQFPTPYTKRDRSLLQYYAIAHNIKSG